jgi:hypothetical protein
MELAFELNNIVLSFVSFFDLAKSRTTSKKWMLMINDYFSSLPCINNVQIHQEAKIVWANRDNFIFLDKIVIKNTILKFKIKVRETRIPFYSPLDYRCKVSSLELNFVSRTSWDVSSFDVRDEIEYYPSEGLNATFVFKETKFEKIIIPCNFYNLRSNATISRIELMDNLIFSFGLKRGKRFDEEFHFYSHNKWIFTIIHLSSVNGNEKKDPRWHIGEWLKGKEDLSCFFSYDKKYGYKLNFGLINEIKSVCL